MRFVPGIPGLRASVFQNRIRFRRFRAARAALLRLLARAERERWGAGGPGFPARPVGRVGVRDEPESLILAQSERWRHA